MKIHRVMRHAGTPAEVYAMSTSKAFQERKCVDAGALSYDVDVTVDGDTAVVRARRKLPTVGFPSIVRKLVPGGGVTSTETISWGPAAADGSRTATLHVDFHGAPAKMDGSIVLTAASDGGADATVDADFVAHVPLIGGKVEKMSAPIIDSVMDAEEATGRSWTAEAG